MVLERFKALCRRIWHRLNEYPIPNTGHTADLVGMDRRGVTHAVTWMFDEEGNLVMGRCGAAVVLRIRGTIDCMTCLVKEAEFTR